MKKFIFLAFFLISSNVFASFTYQYNNKTTSPNLSGIHEDVAISLMTDKNIKYCRWDEDTAILQVIWQEELNLDNESILAGIVIDNS